MTNEDSLSGDNLEEVAKSLDKKILAFINKKTPLILFIILVIAAIIRFKYMNVNVAVWWDEADYLTVVKNFALGTPQQAAAWRARGIALLWSPIYYLGGGEGAIRFFIQIFSVTGVYLTYRVGKEFFNKNVALIGAFIMSVFWLHIFWSARISLGLHGMVIWCAAALLFWLGYVKNKNKWYIAASAALISVGIFIYEAVGFMIPVILIYILITEKHKFVYNKKFWMFAIVGILVALPFFAWNYHSYHERFDDNLLFSIYPRLGRTYEADFGGTERSNEDYARPKGEILSDVFILVKNFPLIFKWPFLISFIVGLSGFLNLILGFDILLKRKDKKLRKDLFILLWVVIGIITVGLLIALTGFNFEPRLWMPVFPILFLISANGIVIMYEYLKKYNVGIALSLVIFLLVTGAYTQLTYADDLINAKKGSFVPIKLGGEWLKDKTVLGDNFIGCGQSVQIVYYSERNFVHLTRNETRNDEMMAELKPIYFIIDGHDPWCGMEPELLQRFIEKYPLELEQVFFLDPETKTQPIFFIYRLKN
jgi:4-amino-4-deoxy-L-arabinose transferase-like glycosyltransferase